MKSLKSRNVYMLMMSARGGGTKEEMLDLKETTVAIFEEAKFELHKWHSNESVLEAKSEPDDGKQSYAKDQLGVKARETKLLGLPSVADLA